MVNKENLRKYAELIVKSGLNLKKGENLQIYTNEHGLVLAREIADIAYELGVNDLVVHFADEKIQRSFYEKANDVTVWPEFKKEYNDALVENNYHRLSVIAADPSLLKGIDTQRIADASKARSLGMKKVMEYTMTNKVKWGVVAAPNPQWAKAIFPELSEEEAVDKLWENIFKATRADLADPVKEWEKHDEEIKKHQDYLNGARFEKLHYEGPGTDLEVYLVENHIWAGGSGKSADGQKFFANIPTEEVFTMPNKYKVNGTLRATMPLALNGVLVDGMEFVFKDGVVTEFRAQKGQEVFENLLKTDDGAKMLGEVALVADNSPISNTGILFQNTLFDENASCHFAVGAAYATNIENGSNLTSEEKEKVGMNESLAHVDFMVGSDKVTVTGIKKDGSEVVLLKDGNWQI